jgi:hypothetical protein
MNRCVRQPRQLQSDREDEKSKLIYAFERAFPEAEVEFAVEPLLESFWRLQLAAARGGIGCRNVHSELTLSRLDAVLHK